MGSFSESDNKDRSGDELQVAQKTCRPCCSIVPSPSCTSERDAPALVETLKKSPAFLDHAFYSLSPTVRKRHTDTEADNSCVWRKWAISDVWQPRRTRSRPLLNRAESC